MWKTKGFDYKPLILVSIIALMVPLLSSCIGGSSGATSIVIAPSETEIYNNGNIATVYNNATGQTVFTISGNYQLTLITDYHWNNGQGASAGTIGLKDASGHVIGAWPVTVRSGVYWDAKPNINIGPGTQGIVENKCPNPSAPASIACFAAPAVVTWTITSLPRRCASFTAALRISSSSTGSPGNPI